MQCYSLFFFLTSKKNGPGDSSASRNSTSKLGNAWASVAQWVQARSSGEHIVDTTIVGDAVDAAMGVRNSGRCSGSVMDSWWTHSGRGRSGGQVVGAAGSGGYTVGTAAGAKSMGAAVGVS